MYAFSYRNLEFLLVVLKCFDIKKIQVFFWKISEINLKISVVFFVGVEIYSKNIFLLFIIAVILRHTNSTLYSLSKYSYYYYFKIFKKQNQKKDVRPSSLDTN